MVTTIKHGFTSQKDDGDDDTEVRPSNWNDDHYDSEGNVIDLDNLSVTNEQISEGIGDVAGPMGVMMLGRSTGFPIGTLRIPQLIYSDVLYDSDIYPYEEVAGNNTFDIDNWAIKMEGINPSYYNNQNILKRTIDSDIGQWTISGSFDNGSNVTFEYVFLGKAGFTTQGNWTFPNECYMIWIQSQDIPSAPLLRLVKIDSEGAITALITHQLTPEELESPWTVQVGRNWEGQFTLWFNDLTPENFVGRSTDMSISGFDTEYLMSSFISNTFITSVKKDGNELLQIGQGPTEDLAFSYLDGDSDREYLITYSANVDASSIDTLLELQFNSDTTGDNYNTQDLASYDNTGIVADSGSYILVGRTAGAKPCEVIGEVKIKDCLIGTRRKIMSDCNIDTIDDSHHQKMIGNGLWKNKDDTINTIHIKSSNSKKFYGNFKIYRVLDISLQQEQQQD